MRLFISLLLVSLILVSRCGSVMFGQKTSIHRAPFLVYVHALDKEYNFVTRTSGILVHQRWVLLSARSCHAFKGFRVAVGSSIAGGADGCPTIKTVVHPNYRSFTYCYCLLKLLRNMKLSRTVQVAVLASPGEHMHANGQYMVVGWGITFPTYTDLAWPSQLHYIRSNPVSYDKCVKYYQKFVQKDVICIGNDTRQEKTGKGDEGAPFFSNVNGKVYAMVVNSYEKEEQERKKWPTMAGNVSMIRQWIIDTIHVNSDATDNDMANLCYGKDQ